MSTNKLVDQRKLRCQVLESVSILAYPKQRGTGEPMVGWRRNLNSGRLRIQPLELSLMLAQSTQNLGNSRSTDSEVSSQFSPRFEHSGIEN
ncbi:hypothetical protein Pla52n_40350 [Stieleria varia]|uniref:Uncharacterized protein n=1 Tax=Stieleria varia TaxID=2528005 RepID=A0A5C6ATZ3_9BACT|nr:hypothetical protein Pla52n_40350 [Stieleria varia]